MIKNPFTEMLVNFGVEHFYGRERILRLMLSSFSQKHPRSFALSGIKTIGKTSLLKYLADENQVFEKYKEYLGPLYVSDKKKLVFVYSNFHKFKEQENLFKVLLCDLKEKLDHKSYLSPSEERVIAELISELEAQEKQHKRVVFLIDDFDDVFRDMKDDDERQMRDLRDRACIVVTAEESLRALRPGLMGESPLLGVLAPQRVALMSDEGARQLIAEPAKAEGVVFSDEEIRFLIDVGGKQPFLLTAVCEAFFDIWDEALQTRMQSEPERLKLKTSFILHLLGLPHIGEILLLLWNKATGIDQQVLITIAGGSQPDPVASWLALQELVNKALIYENISEGTYHIFSALFAEFVKRQELSKTAQPTTSRQVDISRVVETLTPIDKQLFLYLVANPNQTIAFDTLLVTIWDDPNASKRALEAAIYRLRDKLQDLDPDWEYIRNVRGEGYRFVSKGTGDADSEPD